MTCADLPPNNVPPNDLPYTGLPLAALLTLAGACLLGGLLLLVLTRRGRGRTAALTVLLLSLCTEFALNGSPESSAASSNPDCTFTITQTAVITEMAPGVPPAAITGTIVNTAPDSTYVTAVTVAISAVTSIPGSTAACDASDYLLLTPIMPIGRTLRPGESATFTGAFIGFNDKNTNQDTCQAAVVTLTYNTS